MYDQLADEPRQQKHQILSLAKVLRTAEGDVAWKKRVYINPDYTIKQRELHMNLREELKNRREEGENDIVIKNFKIVKISSFRQQQ